MAQGETPLLPDVVDPHNIRRQHFLMLRWVLLCDYCSFYYQLPKTSELGRATNAHITVVVYFRDHYLWFRVCSFAELSSAFIIPPPRALQLSTPTFPSSFFRVTSYEHGACPPRLYTVVYCYAPCRRSGSTGSFLLQRISLHVPLLLSLTTPFSVNETLMDFGYTYAPNLIHQGASVITEISSAHGDKNSASSKQDWSHSWHRINSTALQKGQKLYKMTKKLKGASQNQGARAYARNNNV
jgi:hypothetical protein